MSINFRKVVPILTACVTTGSIVFQIGKQSEKIANISYKGHAQEEKITVTHDGIYDVNNKLNIISNDLQHVKEDINEIKSKI